MRSAFHTTAATAIAGHTRQLSAAIVIAAWLAIASAGHAQTTQPARVVNPHWTTEHCDACHVVRDRRPQPIEPRQVDVICVSCHDGRKAHREAHPIGRVMAGPGLVPNPPEWPLIDGRLSCLTCHDLKVTAGHTEQVRPLEQSDFLRAVPADRPGGFCAACHQPTEYRRLNPHLMMTSEGRILQEACLYCHAVVPPRDVQARTGEAHLRAEPLLLCRSCHYYHVDYYEPGHIGDTIPPKVLAYMRAKEIVGAAQRPNSELLAQLRQENARPQVWLPDEQNRIVCTTCHNPHLQGVFPEGSVLDEAALRLENGGHTAAPLPIPEMCLRCHNL